MLSAQHSASFPVRESAAGGASCGGAARGGARGSSPCSGRSRNVGTALWFGDHGAQSVAGHGANGDLERGHGMVTHSQPPHLHLHQGSDNISDK